MKPQGFCNSWRGLGFRVWCLCLVLASSYEWGVGGSGGGGDVCVSRYIIMRLSGRKVFCSK